MTQKRGLGRGLGALIPGAGATTPAAEPELRTRSQRAGAASGEQGSSTRPVDMFFSGERIRAEEERAARERPAAHDLAAGMAKAAAERRSKSGSRSRGAATAKSGATSTKARSSSPKATPKTDAEKTGSSTEAKRSSAAKAAGTATKSATSRTRTATKGSTASGGARTKKASTAEVPSDIHESPVVDVEPVEPTRVTEPAAPDDSTGAQGGSADAAPGRQDARTEMTGTQADSSATSVDTGVGDSPETKAVTAEPGASEGLMAVPGAEFAEIPIHEIRENPRNPRTMFDEDELDELAFSLRQVGVLQPVVVRPIPVTEDGESFELVMGERRWRAARRAGLTAIPSIIRETTDDDLLRDALLENLHRSQLNPLEEAAAYQQLLEDFGCTQDELGERIGRSRPQITNTLRLLRLPPLVQRRLASGALSAGHARALLSLDDPALMEELAQRIVTEGLSVRAVERLVAGRSQPTPQRAPRRSTYDPHVVDLTSRLSNRLETQVRIDVGKRKGKITLEFTNLEDLERLIESMGIDITDTVGDAQS